MKRKPTIDDNILFDRVWARLLNLVGDAVLSDYAIYVETWIRSCIEDGIEDPDKIAKRIKDRYMNNA